ncbi:unnamed protein product [Prunus armeniaca]|uniref:Protein kinase domain-containing protein n=1 Tax=Prunus armeniaca TaxID=36596 RepID=A0A6J5XDR9_PRUAR|nr:unnamed protein product [Prunus armeniaca]CAB4309018.1 unnamed protein product [Prunus armeniaca]
MSELESSQFEVEDWEFRVGDVGSAARVQTRFHRACGYLHVIKYFTTIEARNPSSKLVESLKRALDKQRKVEQRKVVGLKKKLAYAEEALAKVEAKKMEEIAQVHVEAVEAKLRNHPNIFKLKQVFLEFDGTTYLVFEFMEGNLS